MMLFRSVKKSDLPAIFKLAEQSGVGITTLPADEELLSQRIQWSIDSFSKAPIRPCNEYYFFALEDTITGHVAGTSAIEACIGYDTPFYSYKLSKRTRICHTLNIRSDYDVMSLVNDKQGCSELCTLFLEPDFRHSGNGLLLSKARFLFIAHYPIRFASTIIAEMRGISDDKGNAPFWNAVGKHFFHLSFPEADRLTISTNKQFIADLMPRNPIYVNLIDQAAQAVIGKPHQSTVSAMNILLREGFRHNDYVDIFDAGPTIEAPREAIRTIACSRVMTVKNIIDEVSSRRYLLANTRLDFRATVCQIIYNEKQNTCILSKEAADVLQIQSGDCVRIAPLHADDTNFF